MSTIEKDFDRLARLDSQGWSANNHYHNFLLRYVPKKCGRALEVGCGTGAFSRRLAARANHVTAIDLSAEMIRVARSRSDQFPNIEFKVAEAMSCDFPAGHFDCIATIATLHHIPTEQALVKLKEALKPGGTLLVLDLVELKRNFFTAQGLRDTFLNVLAIGASLGLRLIHNGRLRPPPEVRAAWEEHGKTDSYLTIREARELYERLFPGATVRRRLLWRYSVVWQKPAADWRG
ncbi:MAG TPA: class I SAM-dependent methyltransferase [Pyrinomonadaceae bacterium]|nr:class I SAM-dependent methyltransferase [Pyrinomonadaceae bacterium]